MGNCLVTKLKGSVSNPNLRKLGHVVLDLQSETNKYCPFFNGNANRDIEITLLSGQIDSVQGDATLVDSTHVIIHHGTEPYTGFLTPNASEQFKVDISNYYDLTVIPILTTDNDVFELYQYTGLQECGIEATEMFDVASISKAVHLRRLHFRNSGASNLLYGDFSFIQNFISLRYLNLTYVPHDSPINFTPAMLSNLTSMETIILDYNIESSFVGNITEFGSLVNLTTLRLTDGRIEGTVEEFVAAQIAAGRATCSGIDIGANMGLYVTFQGNPITNYVDKTLSWTSADNITITQKY